MLKTTESLDVSRLEVGNSNSEVVRFGVDGSGEEFIKKSGKLSKFRKMPKCKNCQKVGIYPNLILKKPGPNF